MGLLDFFKKQEKKKPFNDISLTVKYYDAAGDTNEYSLYNPYRSCVISWSPTSKEERETLMKKAEGVLKDINDQLANAKSGDDFVILANGFLFKKKHFINAVTHY